MEKENYSPGDILVIGNELAYLNHKFDEKKFGVSYSKKETHLNLIGSLNNYFLGDGIIEDVSKYEKLDKRNHLKEFGLSYPDKNLSKNNSLLRKIFSKK